MNKRSIYGPTPIPKSKRFWAHVDKNGPQYKELGRCWLWIGHRNPAGYGRFHDTEIRKIILAHRFSFKLEHGRFPEHLALHRCDNPPCVRPSHLYDGTKRDNWRDAASRGLWHPSSKKLVPEQVREIRHYYAEGCRTSELAIKYKVSPTTIFNIVHGISWRSTQ